MSSQIFWQLALQLFLILSNAIFACAEIAVISMSEHKLKRLAQGGNKKAFTLVKLTAQPAKFLATIQVAITFSGFLASAFAADNFSDSLVNFFINIGIEADYRLLDAIAVVLITFILSYVTLVFGELVPKRIAMKKAESIALALASVISFVATITAPLVWLLTKSTNAILYLFGINPDSDEGRVSEEEIILMVDEGMQKGFIEKEEKDIIQNIFDFDDIDISKVSTHRTQLNILWLADNVEQWHEEICRSKHAHYLICEASIDNVIGVLKSRSYFYLEDKSKDNILNTIVKQPYYVLKSVHADIVFRRMKAERQQLAVVIDEYGGIYGIVTINDLLEELVGELDDDEYRDIVDPNNQDIICLGDEWRIKGSTSLEDVAQKLNIALPTQTYQTFTGYIMGIYGSIPNDNTSIEINTEDLNIKAEHIKGKVIDTALVKVKNRETECDVVELEINRLLNDEEEK